MKKKSLLKYAFIPMLFLLLLFSYSESQIMGDSLFFPASIVVPDCAEVHFNKTYSGELSFLESCTIEVSVPSMLETFMVIERRVENCGELGPEEEGRALIWIGWPWEGGGDDYVYFGVYNYAGTAWEETDYKDDGYRDTYEDGDSFWVGPGTWVVVITSEDFFDVCYELTISVWGCPNWGSPGIPAPSK